MRPSIKPPGRSVSPWIISAAFMRERKGPAESCRARLLMMRAKGDWSETGARLEARRGEWHVHVLGFPGDNAPEARWGGRWTTDTLTSTHGIALPVHCISSRTAKSLESIQFTNDPR